MKPIRSLVLQVGVDSVFHTILLLSLFLLFSGHNAPGGGFIGGLVAGAAFVLRYTAEGTHGVLVAARVPPTVLFGLGLLAALVTGFVPMLLDGAFLESDLWGADVPVLGPVKASSTRFFDCGVFLVVVGLVLMVLTVLGDDEPDDGDGPAGPEGTATP